MAYLSYRGARLFFTEFGDGPPVLFLHGNTASSRLFEPLMPLYAKAFRCILPDFLGNGRSDRTAFFSSDLWYEEGLQTAALAEALDCGPVSLVGTSGGAWAALNAALERPELFRRVVADSFDGRTLNDRFAERLLAERSQAKRSPQARQFYAWCQGEDWETVVDQDTQALLRCAREQRPLFRRPLTELQVPVLFLGSLEDEMCRDNLQQEYEEMAALLPHAAVCMFAHGGHPALLSNAEAAARRITAFLLASGMELAPPL